jgi:hypothetical protein
MSQENVELFYEAMTPSTGATSMRSCALRPLRGVHPVILKSPPADGLAGSKLSSAHRPDGLRQG